MLLSLRLWVSLTLGLLPRKRVTCVGWGHSPRRLCCFSAAGRGRSQRGRWGLPGPPREPDSRRILFPNFILTNAAAFDCF